MKRAVIVCLAGLSLVSAPCWAEHKKPEPLPPQLLAAKTVFLAQDPAAEARKELKKWGRFQIVTDPAEAELIFDFDYKTSPWYYHPFSDSMVLTIRDGKTQELLYIDSRVRSPVTYFNSFSNMTRGLVKELRKRIEAQEKQVKDAAAK